MSSLEFFKKNAELLLEITQKYEELVMRNGPKSERRKLELYIQALLKDIERNIKENVKESNQAGSTTS